MNKYSVLTGATMFLALLLAGKGYAVEMDSDAISKFEAAEQERKAEFSRLQDLIATAKKYSNEGKFAEACGIYDDLKLRVATQSGTMAELLKTTIKEGEDNCRSKWSIALLTDAEAKNRSREYNEAIVIAEEAKLVYPKASSKADAVIAYSKRCIDADEAKMETNVDIASPGNAKRDENISRLLRKAQQFAAANKYGEAAAALETVFLLDPLNSEASYQLNKIYTKMYNVGKAQHLAEVEGMLGVSDWAWVTPVVPRPAFNSIGIDNIIVAPTTVIDPMDQLDNIIIPRFDVKDASFASVLTQLADLSRQYDKKYKTGVDIIYREPEDINARPQPVTIENYTNIPLSTLIYIICRENGLYFKVDGSTVKISDKYNNMQTQNFQLSAEIANNIRNNGEDGEGRGGAGGLDGMMGLTGSRSGGSGSSRSSRNSSSSDSGSSRSSRRSSNSDSSSSRSSSSRSSSSRSSSSSGSGRSGGRNSSGSGSSGMFSSSSNSGSLRDNAEPKTIPSDKLISFFTNLGIKFDGDAKISYNPNTNNLTMTNTVENLRHMSDLVRELNAKEVPMVSVEAKIVELSEGDVEELGFQWTFNIPDANGESWWVNAYYGITGDTTGDATQKELIQEGAQPLRFLNGNYKLINNLKIFPNFGEAIFGTKREVNLSLTVNAVDQNSRTEVLSAPTIVTKSGTVGQISMIQRRSYPSSWEDPEVEIENEYVKITAPEAEYEEEETGIEFTVFPRVAQDNYTIVLQLDVMIRDYIGDASYPLTIEAGYVLEYPDKTKSRQVSYSTNYDITMPLFTERSLNTIVKIYDGETIVLGGMIRNANRAQDDKWPILGDIPLLGRFFSSQIKQTVKSNLYIFVSARILKHDGRPLRTRVGGTRPDLTR